jgi:DNA polymerase III subunit delta
VARLTLVTGDEELLVARAVADVLAAARARDPHADVRDLAVDGLQIGDLTDVASPSLFGELRVLVVRMTGAPSDVVRDALISLVDSDDEDLVLVVVHPGGNAGKRVVDAVKSAGAATVECRKPPPWKLLDWVRDEVRRLGGTITPAGAKALLEAVGESLSELAAACSQLVVDVGLQLDEDAVGRYYSGRADVKGWTIAEHAARGRLDLALVELRAGYAQDLDPVLVTSSLARQLRHVAQVASAGRAPRDVIARELGLKAGVVRVAQEIAPLWRPETLAAAHRAIALADAEVKGGAAHAEYAAERAVVAVATAAGGGG